MITVKSTTVFFPFIMILVGSILLLSAFSMVSAVVGKNRVLDSKYERLLFVLDVNNSVLEEVTAALARTIDYDDFDSGVLFSGRFEGFTVSVQDISSRLQVNTFPDSVLVSIASAGDYIDQFALHLIMEHRKTDGLFRSPAELKSFLGEEYLERLSVFGWFPEKGVETWQIDHLRKEFAYNENVSFRPHVTSMPLLNVYLTDQIFLNNLLMCSKFAISQPQLKSEVIYNMIKTRSLSPESLRSVLDLTSDHLIFSYLGFKTLFWEICLIAPDVRVTNVLAFVQRDTLHDSESLKYELISRKVSYED